MRELVRNPSETDSIKSQISSKTSSGKKDSTKDAIKDTTSDSQVNSCFPYSCFPYYIQSLSEDTQSNNREVELKASKTSRILDDLLSIDNNFFDSTVNHIYPSELQLKSLTSQIPMPLF